MKFYKKYYSKFAKVLETLSASKPLDPELAPSNANSINSFSTPLSSSWQHVALLGLLAAASILTIWYIDLSLLVRVVLLFLVLAKLTYDLYQIYTGNIFYGYTELHVLNNKWLALRRNGTFEALQLVQISQGFGLLFVFRFKVELTQKKIHLVLWKSQTEQDFLRYSNQITRFGVPREQN